MKISMIIGGETLLPVGSARPSLDAERGSSPEALPVPSAERQPVWNGKERRGGEDRRHGERRGQQQAVLLNTRGRQERRLQGRRQGDAPARFSFKA